MFLGDVRVVRSHGVVLRGPGSAKTAQVRLRKDGLGVSSVVIGKVPAAPTMPCGAGSSKMCIFSVGFFTNTSSFQIDISP